VKIATAGEPDLPDLLPLMRGYCDFYRVAPSDEDLLGLARALIADPEKDGVQLIARDDDARAVGFATVYWSWSTTRAARIGVMNDLFVAPEARGRRVGEELIERCRDLARERGCASLEWQTAPDNRSGQALYERIGAVREQWVDYHMDV
jgi:GNAT superfamily N-acetyltransferase